MTPEEVDFRIASSLRRILESWNPYPGQDVFKHVLPNLKSAIQDEIWWLES